MMVMGVVLAVAVGLLLLTCVGVISALIHSRITTGHRLVAARKLVLEAGITRLGVYLGALDVKDNRLDESGRLYVSQALDSYAAAGAALCGARRLTELTEVQRRMAEARYAVVCVGARRAGVDVEDYLAPPVSAAKPAATTAAPAPPVKTFDKWYAEDQAKAAAKPAATTAAPAPRRSSVPVESLAIAVIAVVITLGLGIAMSRSVGESLDSISRVLGG